jgi:hypothetical protein
MNPGETLSIILINWNTRDLLLKCVRGLLEDPFTCKAEVWVVDNGSSDGSTEALEGAYPGVRLLRNPSNRGFAAAVNQALTRCRGEYALLLNPDCFPEPGSVELLWRTLSRWPHAAMAGGALTHPDGRPQNSFGAAPTLATELLPKGLLQALFPRRFPSKRHPPSNVIEVEAVVGAFVLVRRQAWEDVGGMDEGYFFFLEETDWCLRMARRGWRILHVPQARAVHLQGQSAKRALAAARVEFYRSRYRFFRVHRGSWSERILKAGLVLRCVANWAFSGVAMRLSKSSGARWGLRHEVDKTLLMWHLRGRPEGWGLAGRVHQIQGGTSGDLPGL